MDLLISIGARGQDDRTWMFDRDEYANLFTPIVAISVEVANS